MLFFNNNYLANMKEFCIALTVTGSLLFIFHIFYFLYICSVSCYTIFKKEKYAQIDLFVNIVVLSLNAIVSCVLSYITSIENEYWPYTLVWWILTILVVGIIVARFIFINEINKEKYKFFNINEINVNKLRSKFKIENWKVSNGILNPKKKWDQSLSNEYINLSNRINEISINQIDKTRVDLISDIIMFNENYSSVFCVKKRKYAMLLFTNLIEQLQKKLSILK